MNIKRIALGLIGVALVTWGLLGLNGCAALDKAAQNPADQALVKTGTTILCVIEEEEIDDPALNAICSSLATQPDAGLDDSQRQILARYAAKKVERAKAKAERLNATQDGGAK